MMFRAVVQENTWCNFVFSFVSFTLSYITMQQNDIVPRVRINHIMRTTSTIFHQSDYQPNNAQDIRLNTS